MRPLTENEVITLQGLLQMETNGLLKAKAAHMMITDEDLKKESESGILAAEGRIKGLQQFIYENNILNEEEAH
ncbi:hypothetical protein U472_06935 [Orenia metallireducens]|uniref:Spore coat protein n=1 Tax=Orenia metallireducens TaxID=1413210 RepID=A0A1C0AA87_9FIRM|nr:hypothetical protein [Orenia metallireducens]OCL27200.1 hypothetical protein U472_06935 [Orenia metallireducens]